jgi:replication factor A2
VGKVLSVTEDSVTFNLTLEDGTGRVAVKMYSTDESDLERQARSELREGIYARVFGHVGAMNHERHVVAFSIRPVTDHNEVSYHLSQVIFQHLHLAKGGDAAAAAAPAAAAGGAAYGAAYGAPAGGMGGAPAAGGQTPVQKEVLDVFNAPDARALEAGLTVPDVLARLGGRYPPQAVLGAVNFLVDEGHLYSTIDDAHWKSCCA